MAEPEDPYLHPAEALSFDDVLELLNIHKPPHLITTEDIVNQELASVNDWQVFYYGYAKARGFSVRKEYVYRNKDNKETHRNWVCSCEGFRRKEWLDLPQRKKQAKPITRVGCEARLNVKLLQRTGNWVVQRFVEDHNHELASPSELQFLRSHRVVPVSVMEQAKAMRNAGMQTMNILDFVSHQFGGRHQLPFLKADLYNKLAVDRRSVAHETDCEGALGYLTCAAVRDPNFYCRFNVDEQNRLHSIFWADGISRRDYSIFGEVLAFDTTYRTNAYNKPLLIMVGVNHHFRTSIFGVALLADESAETFEWILEHFHECMNNKHPTVVITDGDLAMRAAIQKKLPSSIHRLCAWHMENNASSNVPNGEFKIVFSRLLYHFFTEEEFEEQWGQVRDQHSLQHNAWATSLYEKRHQWAETFLRGNFVGGLRTTQRCESMNAYMRRFLHSKQLLRDFVTHIDQCIQSIRHTELHDDYTTKHTHPVLPKQDALLNIYEQAATTYTRAIYRMAEKQLQQSHFFCVTASEYTTEWREYRLSKYRKGEIRHTVRFNLGTSMLNCGCLLFETDGIPCCHIFCVMKHLSCDRIPEGLIKPCWCRDIKRNFTTTPPTQSSQPQSVMLSNRMATLCNDFHSLGFLASSYEDTFQMARFDIKELTDKFHTIIQGRDSNFASTPTYDPKIAAENNILRDPTIAKTKGREKNQSKGKQKVPGSLEKTQRRCRRCNNVGHNRQTCQASCSYPGEDTNNQPTPTTPSSLSDYANTLASSQHGVRPLSFSQLLYDQGLHDNSLHPNAELVETMDGFECNRSHS